jgi:hypothetical protein
MSPSNVHHTPATGISGNTPSAPVFGALNETNGIALVPTGAPVLGLLIGVAVKQNSKGVMESSLVSVDLDDYQFSAGLIPLPFVGHGFAPNPARPHIAALFEKRGKGACEVDLTAGTMIRPIETAANRKFYGHGAYSADGSLLYATETITEGNFDGVIVVRDAETLQVLGEFPSFGPRPHDCIMIDGGNTMVITNGGGFVGEEPGSVTYVDVNTQQLLDKLEIDNHDMNAGHVAVSAVGDIAVVSAPREGMDYANNCGGLSIGSANRPFSAIREPSSLTASMLGESLSVCIDENNRVAAVTTPAANLVSFWNLDSGELLHNIEVPMPRGITLTQNGQYYALSYGQSEQERIVSLLHTDDFRPVAGHDMYAHMAGSHIFSYSFPQNS